MVERLKCQKRISAKPENRCVVLTQAGSYLRLIDFCITQLTAQGPSRTCNESKEEEEEEEEDTHPTACGRARREQLERLSPENSESQVWIQDLTVLFILFPSRSRI